MMTEILTKTGGAEEVTMLAGIAMTFIGICAFFTTVITEGLKSIRAINRMPTKLVCYIVALVITPLVFVAAMAYMNQPVEWFMVFAALLAAFVVAKASMSGWDDIAELTTRLIR